MTEIDDNTFEVEECKIVFQSGKEKTIEEMEQFFAERIGE